MSQICYAAKEDDPELLILLPPPSEFWAFEVLLSELIALYMLGKHSGAYSLKLGQMTISYINEQLLLLPSFWDVTQLIWHQVSDMSEITSKNR